MIMPYTGTGELQASFEKEQQKIKVDQAITKEKVVQNKQKEVKEIQKQKQELANVIAEAEFTKVFKSYYGDAYDENAINKTLKVNMDSGFSPQVVYTVKTFNVKNDFLNSRKSFNQNTNIKEILGSQQDFTSLNSISNIRINNIENPGDLKESVLADIFNDNRELYAFEKKQSIVEPKYVYKEAETLFLQEYNKQYKKTLEPRIKAKYGFNI